MAVIVEVFPQCDTCGDTFFDSKENSVRACRRAMKKDGWVKWNDGETCPDCWKRLTKPDGKD